MRVALVAGKRGHYYLTARALQREGVLARFVTSTFFKERSWRRRLYPARSVAVRSDASLEEAAVTSLWPVELGYRLARAALGKRHAFTSLYNRLFDLASVPYLEGDVLHVANTYARFNAAAARRAGMKVVIDQQSVHPRYLRAVPPREYARAGIAFPPRNAAKDRAVERELEQADLVLVPSRFVRDENVRAGLPSARQRVVPIGVDTQLFQPGAATPRAGPLRVLCVGSVSVAKGCHVLLEAARRLGPDRVRLRLVGATAPETRELLGRYAGLCEHLPPMPQHELVREYRGADVFCLPSLAEGSALVVYEAMACGLPCVVTPAAGSVIEHDKDGWIVGAGEVATALSMLVRDPDLRARLGRNARATACRYDVASYGRRLVDAYSALHQARNRPGSDSSATLAS